MVSATSTPRQADPSTSSTATVTNKQVDPMVSASTTPKQADPSASSTYKPVDPKPSPSAKPSRYPRQTFNLLFQNANNTLIRSSPKLQQLQTALACVVQTPLENIELTSISVGSTDLPFTKPQGSGAPNCTAAARLLYRQRRLQAANTDTTVSFDLLNAPYVSQAAFQTDPTILAFATSVGSSGQVSGAPVPAPASTNIGTNTGAIYGGVIGGLCVVGIASYYGVVYFRTRRSPVRRASSKPKIQETINPFAPNNKISYSPAVVKITRSNSV